MAKIIFTSNKGYIKQLEVLRKTRFVNGANKSTRMSVGCTLEFTGNIVAVNKHIEEKIGIREHFFKGRTFTGTRVF